MLYCCCCFCCCCWCRRRCRRCCCLMLLLLLMFLLLLLLLLKPNDERWKMCTRAAHTCSRLTHIHSQHIADSVRIASKHKCKRIATVLISNSSNEHSQTIEPNFSHHLKLSYSMDVFYMQPQNKCSFLATISENCFNRATKTTICTNTQKTHRDFFRNFG